jgi:hypothetical protein
MLFGAAFGGGEGDFRNLGGQSCHLSNERGQDTLLSRGRHVRQVYVNIHCSGRGSSSSCNSGGFGLSGGKCGGFFLGVHLFLRFVQLSACKVGDKVAGEDVHELIQRRRSSKKAIFEEVVFL